ncbi:MAG: hypothetical protein N3A02_00155 [Rectinema sp.]|nr:hypothetical protein [Rectinema sp.]
MNQVKDLQRAARKKMLAATREALLLQGISALTQLSQDEAAAVCRSLYCRMSSLRRRQWLRFLLRSARITEALSQTPYSVYFLEPFFLSRPETICRVRHDMRNLFLVVLTYHVLGYRIPRLHPAWISFLRREMFSWIHNIRKHILPGKKYIDQLNVWGLVIQWLRELEIEPTEYCHITHIVSFNGFSARARPERAKEWGNALQALIEDLSANPFRSVHPYSPQNYIHWIEWAARHGGDEIRAKAHSIILRVALFGDILLPKREFDRLIPPETQRQQLLLHVHALLDLYVPGDPVALFEPVDPPQHWVTRARPQQVSDDPGRQGYALTVRSLQLHVPLPKAATYEDICMLDALGRYRFILQAFINFYGRDTLEAALTCLLLQHHQQSQAHVQRIWKILSGPRA